MTRRARKLRTWWPLACLGCLVACSTGGDGTAPETRPPARDTAVPPPAATASPQPSGPAPPADVIEVPEQDIEQLRRAAAQNPNDPGAAQRLAVALLKSGRTDEAIQVFETLAERSPTVGNLLNLGKAYADTSMLGQAEAAYRRLLQIAPNQPTALHALGNLAYRRGNPQEAVGWYRQAVAAKSDYILARVHLGDALRADGKLREAYVTYSEVLQFQPTSAVEAKTFSDAIYEMAALDLSQGEAPRAAQLLEELIQLVPDHESAHYAYGQALMQLGRPDEAQAEFARHMELLARRKPEGPAATAD